MEMKHLDFLLLMLVIVIIKVKVIIRKREGNGPVRSRAGPPQVNAFQTSISCRLSATVRIPAVVARISSTVRPGAISRRRNPVPVGSNRP